MAIVGEVPNDFGAHWSAAEVDQSAFKDARLGHRFADLLKRLGDGMGRFNSICMSGLGKHESGLSFFRQRAGGGRRDLEGAFCRNENTV